MEEKKNPAEQLVFKSEEDKEIFFNEYQDTINASLRKAHAENEDKFFVQKKAFQYLAAIGAMYTLLTANDRLKMNNTLLLGSYTTIALVAALREKRQYKNLCVTAVNEAHYSFCTQKIAQAKMISDKIRLLNFLETIVPIEKLNQKNSVNMCYYLSSSILAGGFLFEKISFEPGLLAGSLIWGSCTLANYINNNTEIKLIYKNLPKGVKISSQNQYER